MESREISDAQITASSHADWRTVAIAGRLKHRDGTGGLQGAWVPALQDVNEWLQIDLLTPHISVTRVATQGRDGNRFWVSRYKLQYSNDEVNFQYHREHGQTTDKVKYMDLGLRISKTSRLASNLFFSFGIFSNLT